VFSDILQTTYQGLYYTYECDNKDNILMFLY
jgi:hypothetical protein